MSIFGRSQTSVTPEVTAPVFEGYEAEINGDILAIQESWEDQLAVIEALHSIDMEELAMQQDVKALQESGAEASEIEARESEFEAVTEASVGDAWAAIKKFFTNLWGKLTSFFKSVVAQFVALTRSGEAFAKKYEDQLKGADLAGFKYALIDYSNVDAAKFMDMDVEGNAAELLEEAKRVTKTGNGDKALETITNKIAALKEKKDDDLNAYRGKLIGTGSLSEAQFGDALYQAFRGGTRDKKEVQASSVDIAKVVAALKDDSGKKKAEEFKEKTDKEFSNILKQINEIEKDIKKKDSDAQKKYTAGRNAKVLEALRTYSTIFNAKKSVQMAIFRAWKTAYSERTGAYKAVCLAALRHKPGKSSEGSEA